MILKADFHIHTKEDSEDKIKYSAKEIIDKASKLHYDVLSITLHNSQYYNDEIKKYAKKKDILLIPGIEKTIEGKHILLINFKEKELEQIKTIKDIKKFKHKNNLVVAPHPFYKFSSCLDYKLIENIKLFDAIEHCFFYSKIINLNKKIKNKINRI